MHSILNRFRALTLTGTLKNVAASEVALGSSQQASLSTASCARLHPRLLSKSRLEVMRNINEAQVNGLLKPLLPSLINFQQTRGKRWANVRPITGKPRPPPAPGFIQGEPHLYRYMPIYPKDGHYTIKPLNIRRLGGRDPDTGRVVVRTIGGGNKKMFRWIDPVWERTPGQVREYKVYAIRYDPLRTSRLALVAGHGEMRWRIAAAAWEPGTIVKVYSDIPRNPIRPEIGNIYPIGALPVGTFVSQIETYPGEGAHFCVNGGTSSEIVRRVGDMMIFKTNRKRKPEWQVDARCMCVVGQVSNPDNQDIWWWCRDRTFWMGKRCRSGQWHRKDGYSCRKNKKPKPPIVLPSDKPPEPEIFQMHLKYFS